MGGRPHCRSGPAPRPARSASTPASPSAWAGSPAGPLGRASGLLTGLGWLPGRPTRVHPRPPCWPGQLPCRPALLASLALWPACRPGPAPRPAHAGSAPACLPAWAGSQAGLPFPILAARKIAQRPYFWSPYLRGFLPKINIILLPTS